MNEYSELFNKDQYKTIGICYEWRIPGLEKDLTALSAKYNLVIYGLPIKGLVNKNSEDPSMDLIRDYKEGKIDGFVRGVNDDYTFIAKYKKEFNFEKIMRLAFLKDYFGREFCLGPLSASEAVDAVDRMNYALVACRFIQGMGVKPRVAVMSICRKGSTNFSESNKVNWQESDNIVEKLRANGFEAVNMGIEIDKAVEKYNFILPVNGVVGNQIFRTLVILGGGGVLGMPAFNIEDFSLCYEDNSRNEESYCSHVKAALVWSNLGKH